MKVNIFITVDAEHSIGGALNNPNLKPVGNDKRMFGKVGNNEYGIPLIMDIAELYEIPLTFFVEVFSKSYFGEDETKIVCEYILKRGHEIQLHLHPLFLNFGMSNPGAQIYKATMYSYDLNAQNELIQKGKDTLISYGVKNPIAFRAGGFAANCDTLKALKRNGFLIDSSHNRRYFSTHCKLDMLDINDIYKTDGIWELPITNFWEFSSFKSKKPKPLDINGVSFHEIKSVLEYASRNGPFYVTILMHSFSFIQNSSVHDKRVRIRYHVIKRFEKLCKFLSENKKIYNVRAIGSLCKKELETMIIKPNHNLPSIPSLVSFVRLLEQGKERINWL